VSLRKFGSRYGKLWCHSENLGIVPGNFGAVQKILGIVPGNFGVVQKIWESFRETLTSLRKFGSRSGKLWRHSENFGNRSGKLWRHSEILGIVPGNFGVTQKIWESFRETLTSLRKFGKRSGKLWCHSENFGVAAKLWESLRKFGSRYGELWGMAFLTVPFSSCFFSSSPLRFSASQLLLFSPSSASLIALPRSVLLIGFISSE
jgi:hypothetical protein